MNITHKHPEYVKARAKLGKAKYNGAYYYAKEIHDNIMPLVNTERMWNTVGQDFTGMHDGAIVFLHSNSSPWVYSWLKKYKDLILVCSCDFMRRCMQPYGKTILLPMSVDTEYVKQFATEKTKDVCFVGNEWVFQNCESYIDVDKVDFLKSLPRKQLLTELAKYKKAYAIDRCAIEAKALNCKLLPIQTRYSVDNVGHVLDNREAAEILQLELDKIERR